MATITGTLKIRPARKDDLPAIMRLGYRAFKGRAMNEAVMPLHLRTNKDDPDAEALEFRLKRAQKNFDDPLVNNLVVVDDNELIVGWANWGAPPPPSPPQSAAEKAAAEEASEAKNVATAAELPSSVDRDAWWTIVRKTDELWAMLRDALTEEEYTRAWREYSFSNILCLNAFNTKSRPHAESAKKKRSFARS